MNKLLKYSQVALIAISLSACGGGGGGGGGGPSAPTNTPATPPHTPNTPPDNNANLGGSGGSNSGGNLGGGSSGGTGSGGSVGGGSNFSGSSNTTANTTPPNNQGGAVTPPSGGNTNQTPPNSNQITPQPPQNLPKASVENLRPALIYSINDEDKVMKIGVIDTDFVEPRNVYFNSRDPNKDVGDTYKDENGQNRLILNEGSYKNANGIKNSHGTQVSAIIARYTKNMPIYGYTAKSTDKETAVSATNQEFMDADESNVRIINNSWGSLQDLKNPSSADDWRKIPAAKNGLFEYIAKQASTNSIIVFATGNENKDYASLESHIPVIYNDINARKGFIAVSATTYNQKAPYANKLGSLAKVYGISTDGRHTLFQNTLGGEKICEGTSCAAPVVSAAAANVWEKFPWMSNHLVVQSILSTANQLGQGDNVTTEPRDDVGWGVLNQARALKGPARFDKRLLADDEKNFVVADFNYRNYTKTKNGYTAKDRLTFSNDITGDAGFKKKGTGILYFTGSNSYTGETIVENGYLQIEKELTNSKVTIQNSGTLIARNDNQKVTIGNNNGYTLTNNGSLEVFGQGLTINGNYKAGANSRTAIDINTAQLEVKGTADMGNSRILAHINKVEQVPQNGQQEKTILTAQNLTNYSNYYTISDYINPYIKIDELKTEGNQVKVKFTRNSTNYVARAIAFSTTSSLNTANNLDTALNEVAANSSSPLSANALSIITATPFAITQTLQTLSAEIYASSQNALLNQNHQISQKMATRTLSDESGFYSSYDYNRYEISRQGFASGDTKSHLTSVGVDKSVDDFKFGVNLNRGEIKSEFTNLAGSSKITTNGVNFYAKADFSDFYTLFGTGVTWLENSVKRNLIIADDGSQINVKQNGKIYNLYAEAGYSFGFFTPFLAYELNMFRQNGIDEGQNFGIKSEKTSNDISSYLSGVRANFNAQNFSFNAALTYIYTPNADFDFKAKFVGGNSDITIKGINVAKNQVGLNFGVGYSFTPSFGVFSSYALNKGKDTKSQNLNVGVKYKF
ncbi:S8 family serine peptidase [Campylobacter gastrosuis]|uniref:S8 family serine peptidase n=1 Tax=Campylobacter gastrosuis TaxID=2974576 RepID=A0ABT7HRU8_9BACT|nr:S8 family serine peptidase [Campylobacter gastrosuis]MDL0089626.1 S8 family serine peptidase [Campylobacter gastrosuis]